MKMASKYKVEYIQVNINVGDCEIILLLEEKGGKDTIKYSVLVDGGEGHGIPTANIQQVFKKIGTKYRTFFRLDAIVITHWDKDHYGGILKLLVQAWNDKALNLTSFMKYENGKPQTRLYIPYKRGNIDSDDLKAVWTDDHQFGFKKDKKDKKGKKTGEEKLFVCEYLADTPGMRKNQLEQEPVAWDFDQNKSELIGRNLFTDVRPNTLDQVNTANPTALVGAHGAKMPGLYCVAVNNQFLGVGTGSAGGDENNKNRSSIVCMIIHPDGTVSHYLAGDAHQELEAKVIEWTGFTTLSQPISKVDDKDRIAIVKASHHGSFTATPIEMCQTYKPKYFVFSAGNKHRHPMWEVLLYVCSYYRSLGKNISPKIDGRDGILMTSFPYWMRSDVQHFLPPEDPQPRVERYRKTIEDFFRKEPQYVRELYEWVMKAKDKADEIRDAKKSRDMAKEDSAKKEKDKIEEQIRTVFGPILKNRSPISKDNYVFPGEGGKMISHVSYISFLLDGPEPVEVKRIGPGFKSLPTKRSLSATPGPSGSSAPKKLKT
ncbi:hypothetical protein APHAL10511_002209 [Amanita phalloides]|nr:hypothetical protein APHAL10511_002209 [Amanita phalloides]